MTAAHSNIKRKRVGILISGRGSNMRALIEACKADDYPAEIVTVISNRPNAAGLEYARAQNIQTVTIDHKQYASREPFERALHQALIDAGVELICNAGFMRLLTSEFVDLWHNRQLNIHPSILPAFKGLHTHERAIQAGVKITGCTVHIVRTEMDSGPIIAQAAVSISSRDTDETLSARVLKAEHHLYPRALALIASGEARIVGEHIIINNQTNNSDNADKSANAGEIFYAPPLMGPNGA